MLDVGTSMQIGVQIWQPFRPEADPVQIGVARRVSLLPLGGQLPISRVGSQTPYGEQASVVSTNQFWEVLIDVEKVRSS